MDTLSEMLRSVRLKGGVFLDARFTAPWSAVSALTPEDCRALMVDPGQICSLHYVIEGELTCEVDGEPPLKVSAGELLLLPRNDTHTLASTPGQRAMNVREFIEPGPDGLGRIVYGGGGAATHLVCGYLANEDRRSPLLSTLPRVLKIGVLDGTSREWVESSARYAARQLSQGILASSSVMARLSELLFVEAVRAYAASLSDERKSWLAGLKDAHVGQALALLHNRLADPWTTDSLAREIGVSRSVLIERFTAALAVPPMRYLTQARMALAKELLLQGRKSVPQIALEAGYEAEAAFNRAFKREVGLPPIAWRDSETKRSTSASKSNEPAALDLASRLPQRIYSIAADA